MQHVSDIELIELMSGRLSSQRRAAVEAHVSGCEHCRRRREEIARTWHLLGEWSVRPPKRHLAPAVEAAIRRQGRRLVPFPARPRWARPAARVAASVLLAVTVGQVAGRWARPKPAVPPEAGWSAGPEADAESVAEALYLTVFEGGSPAGLADALLGVAASAEEEVTR